MRIPTAAAAAFVMTALAQIAVPPAIGQTIPDSLKQSGSNETAIKEKRNAWTVGVAGGAPGAVGVNYVERADGGREDFGATFAVEMNAGDVFVVETPGGGGYGPPPPSCRARGNR